MVEALLRFSLHRRWLVVGAAALLLVLGAWRAAKMPVDVFPDLTAPQVTIVTEASGMAPQELEQLVTFAIETAVNGVAGVRRVRSASAEGISIVWVEFDWDTSAADARQRVAEKLQGITGTLPREASAPLLAPASSVMGEIAFIALTSDRLDGMELRRIAERGVRRRLLAVPGISQVVAIGGDERQFQVRVDPERSERYGLTVEDLASAIEHGSTNAPGGYLVEGGQESLVRVLGRATDVTDIERIVVAVRGGTPVLVRQIADVVIAPNVRRGTGSYRAQPAVVMSIQKQPGADTLEATQLVDAVLDAMKPELKRSGITIHRDIFRQSTFIRTSIANLFTVLRDGAVLVILVLLAFLWSLRPTIISVLAIPLSLVTAVLVLDALGMTLDTMTLGGLAIALGELVDDAIVDVENVVRRLRERELTPEDARPPVMSTVFEASREIRTSIVSATFVIVLVFLPLFFLEGLEGRLLRPLATSYIVAILASLVVAITITPALCYLLLGRGSFSHKRTESPVLRFVHRAYEPVLRFGLRSPRIVAVGAAGLIAASLLGFLGLGRSFLPEFNEGSLTIAIVTLPGTSLEQSDALGRMAEEALLSDEAVVSTSRRTGRAERDEHVQGVEASEIEVMLRPDGRSKEEVLASVRSKLALVPGVQVTLGQPISHRIDHMVSGQRASLSIKVVGEDLQALRRTAQEVERAARDTPGLVDVTLEPIVDVPQVVVHIDPERAATFGLSRGAAAQLVGAALHGRTVGSIYEGGAATDIVVRYGTRPHEDLSVLRRLRVPTPTGAIVPLSSIAEIRAERAPNYILRENVQRRIAVSANVAGRDLRSAYEDARARIERLVRLPRGVHIEYAGQFERQEAASQRLLLLGIIVVLGIALIVGTSLGSVRRAIIVLTNLPLALAGGVVGVYLGGGVLSVASIIGFITLFGIATRNGIMLATHANYLEQQGVPFVDAVARSARERLAPILMTAIAAGLGLVPLALAMGEPGSEIQAPMAIVILCGLVTSTALNMLVVPAFLARWGQARTSRTHGSHSLIHTA